MITLALALAALVGLLLGLLGGGGSILTVPIFVYVLGCGAKDAIAMSLAVVGATSLFGAAKHWRAGNVNPRVALTFGGIAMTGSYLGTRLATFVSGPVQLALFAIVMLVAAFFMFRDQRTAPTATRGGAIAACSPPLPFWQIALPGVAVGTLTGLVGVGGGFLIVPALVLLAKVPVKQAVGTSLLVIAMNAAAGFVGYLGQAEVQWEITVTFMAVAIAGILVGSTLVRFVPPHTLRRSFAVFLVLMGVFILYQHRAVLVLS